MPYGVLKKIIGALAMLGLVSGLWAGLMRIGWQWAGVHPSLSAMHGPLMLCGFVGTLIGLERAVALGKIWGFFGPIATALGTILILGGWGMPYAALGAIVGSALLVIVFGRFVYIYPAFSTVVTGLGAVAWLTGNVLWFMGWPIFRVLLWWIGFLVLTIAGERLEINRLLKLSRSTRAAFVVALLLYVVGLVSGFWSHELSARLSGVGLLVLALWLLGWDLARRTVRTQGVSRYIAVGVLAGYGWLALGGVLSLSFGATYAGYRYDAMVHSIFVGFTLSMIFAHAPIIFPALSGRPLPYTPYFYVHAALLHLGLGLRVASDLAQWPLGWRWGGLLNVSALVLFIFITACTSIRALLGQGKKT